MGLGFTGVGFGVSGQGTPKVATISPYTSLVDHISASKHIFPCK